MGLIVLIIGFFVFIVYIFILAWMNPNEACKPQYWTYENKYGKNRKYRWL